MVPTILFFLAIAASEATSDEVSPIEKVIEMLTDLQAEVITEGKAEAETYDKYACFCKDVTEEKSKAIEDGTAEQEELMATIEKETSNREKYDEKMQELQKRLGEIFEETKEAEAKRHEEKLLYDSNVLDMEGALRALDAAIAELKASKPSLLQMKAMLKNVRKAAAMADALGFGSPKAQKALMAMFAQKDSYEVPDEVYEFHSQEIIDLLEDLLKDFKEGKEGLDKEEKKANDAHDKVIAALEEEKGEKEKEMEDAKADKAKAVETIAQKSGEVTTVSATLLDDQEYLKDLSAKCNDKAKLWEERSGARSDELNAVSTAISIIKGVMKDFFVQVRAKRVLPAKINVALLQLTQEKDVAVHEQPLEIPQQGIAVPRQLLADLGFLQVGSKPVLSAVTEQSEIQSQNVKRDAVVSLLKSEAKTLKSSLLSNLAQKVAGDPFAKIKKLIQELIERLLQEAADEASHKGWCDKEMSKAKQQRTYKVEELEKLNAALAKAEALRDKLTEEVDTLNKEIKALGTELEDATSLRDKEKEENEATIKESKEAKEAVGEAIKVLKDFYAKNAFLQSRQEPPDAGFDGAYKGKSGKAGGIIGMLEVVESDFARTEKETTEAETQAAKDFIEFERDTSVSKKTKETAVEAKDAELKETEGAIETDKEGMTNAQKSLDSALSELQELHAACVDTGMSYEEKKEQREQELESLKKALCILDKQGPVQTEDC